MNKNSIPIRYRDISRPQSFKYAWHGLVLVFKHELNFKIHLVCASAALTMGIILPLSHTEWAAIILSIALVIAAEMMNSAIEGLCNHVHPEESSAIGAVKDIASGAVLFVAICAAIIGAFVFLPHLMKFIS